MNNKTPAQIPKGRVATLFGGVALFAAGFATVWYGLLRLQARKDERGIYTPWEYRILQAQAAAGNPTKPGMSSQGYDATASHPDRFGPGPLGGILATHSRSESDVGTELPLARASDRAPQTRVGASADSNSGTKLGAAPQNTREDGRAYTKAP